MIWKSFRLLFIFILVSLSSKSQIIVHDYENKTSGVFNSDSAARAKKKEDALRYYRLGIIPYQFFSRSSGVYAGIDFEQISLEGRLTYTYETDYVSTFMPFPYDKFYYSGINGAILIGPAKNRGVKVSGMLIYRNWHYYNKWVFADGISTWSSYSYQELKSSVLNGYGFGLDLSWNLSKSNFEIVAFTNLSWTICDIGRDVYEVNRGNNVPPGTQYPRREFDSKIYGALAAGFKFGWRKVRK